ncbi:MAG: hypothetical protein E7549_06530 [Ruminococcaceae bacterium]|nr:hypothetical protein [Oscillospiraceae bacterium]
MKRIVVLLSAAALLLCFAACNKAPADGKDTAATTTATTTGDTVAGETTTAGGNTTGDTTTAGDAPAGSTTGTTAPPSGDVQGATQPPTTTTTTTAQVILDGEETFKETTVVDTASCRVTVTDIEEDGELGYTLHARFENLTSDTDCLFAVDTAAINGVLAEPLYVSEVAAGETFEDVIIFTDVVPEGVDIGEYTDIMLVFSVSDVDDWEAPPIAEKAAHIYPLGASKATVYRHTAQAGGQLLLDNEYVTVIAVNSAEDTKWGGYYSDIYFLNKTAEGLLFSIDEATINSYGIEPYFATYILPGYATFSKVEWLEDSLENSHIETVEKLEFLLTVYREMDWENIEDEEDLEDAVLVSEEIRYTP